MTRLDKLLSCVRREDKILEIGASYNPAVPKRAGWKSKVLDHGTREELIEKYLQMHSGANGKGFAFDVSRIEEVDYVWHGGPLESAVPKEEFGTFDVCVASHVIEHTPDIIGFIRSLEVVLKPGGLICLAVPDKRYCFDYFQSLSTTGNAIDAMGNVRHSRGKVFASSAYAAVTRNHAASWFPGHLCQLELGRNLADCLKGIENYTASPKEPYVDCHGWFFTPHSFQLMMIELGQLGLIQSGVFDCPATESNEFFVTLKKGLLEHLPAPELKRQRLKLLELAYSDLLEPAADNPRLRVSSLRRKMTSYKQRVKETLALLAQRSWLAPVYRGYRHYYRDQVQRHGGPGGAPWTGRERYEAFRDATMHVIRWYHYRLTIGTRLGSWWRLRNSSPVESTAHRVIKPLATSGRRHVIFVTYHPQGYISDHVKYYVGHFKRTGFSVILTKVVDDLNHPLADSFMPEADAVLVRKNEGYDFAAWACAMRTFPEVFKAEQLWIANDSVFGPANTRMFDELLDRVEKSGCDLVGLTESHQYTDHYQSYLLVFRDLPRWGDAVQEYWQSVRNIPDKLDVIFEYELALTPHFVDLGMNYCGLFSLVGNTLSDNPTFQSWQALLEAGFPFIKVSLVKPELTIVDNSKCRETFGKLGYEIRLIDDHLQNMNRKF